MADRKGTILVVDDELEALALLAEILTEEGYHVRAADSGELALASVTASAPELILLDLQMPVMDGFEVCRRLKAGERTREIPVIFITASADTGDRVRGLALGAVEYVTKPFERAELLARVRTHLELGRLRSHLEVQVAKRSQELFRAVVERLLRGAAERKRAKEALHESEERFRNMANTAPVQIVVSDAHQQATFFNKRWLDLTGRTLEQEQGHGWTASVHPEDLERCLATMSYSYQARGECHLEFRLRRVDGEYRSLICNGTPRFEPDGAFAGYIASCIDITELKRSQEKALATQKLEHLGMLAAGIAHDFNNLLSSIRADSELLLADLDDASPAREGIERIEAVAGRASEIVRQLMVYAGQESPVFEQVDLAGLVREMLLLTKASISKNAVLKVDLPEKLPVIRANPAQIRQVFLNLITNASDALGDKEGVISVTLKHVQPSQESSAQQAPKIPRGDCLRLEVSDTGHGMTEAIQTRIFDPFFTTKSAGRGLGLAASQGIIRAHGGSIRVVSAPGQGSLFEILLPCLTQAEQDSDDIAIAASAGGGGTVTGTVLIIEDEDTLRLAVAKMLGKRAFSVIEAGDGKTGVDLFRAHALEIDVVLLDLTLPGMSGHEVLEELRKMRPDVKVILTTAYARDRAFAAVVEQESLLYIRKPYQINELTELVRTKLRRAAN